MTTTVYATQADMVRFGVTSPLLTGLTSDQIDGQLSSKSALASGFFGSRYPQPLTSWGDDLRECVCVLAAEGCLALRGHNPKDPAKDPLTLRANFWRAWLVMLGANKVTLAGGAIVPAVGGPTIVSGPYRGGLV